MARKAGNGGGDQGDGGGGHGYHPPPPPPEFQPANYIFTLNRFHIDNTRAVDEDTDHVSFAVKIGDQVYGPQVRHMGDVDNGDHPVNLQFGPFLVDHPYTPVCFNYQIVNSGHEDNGQIEKQLESGTIALLGKVFSLSTPWTAALAIVFDFLVNIFDVNCDGAVAVDQICITGADLWAWTSGTGSHIESRFYPGTDSDVGCGSNSEYYVTWALSGVGVVASANRGHAAALARVRRGAY